MSICEPCTTSPAPLGQSGSTHGECPGAHNPEGDPNSISLCMDDCDRAVILRAIATGALSGL